MSSLRNGDRFSAEDDERVWKLWFDEGLRVVTLRKRFNCGAMKIRCSIDRWCVKHKISFKEANQRRKEKTMTTTIIIH